MHRNIVMVTVCSVCVLSGWVLDDVCGLVLSCERLVPVCVCLVGSKEA